MAQYVVIEFDDDDQAESLCASINAATRKGKKFRLVGRFQRPKKWCMCYRTTANYKQWNLTQGAKFGWWTCPECRRPVIHDQQIKNMLKPEDIIDQWSAEGRAFYSPAVPNNANPRQYTLTLPTLNTMCWPRGNNGIDDPNSLR